MLQERRTPGRADRNRGNVSPKRTLICWVLKLDKDLTARALPGLTTWPHNLASPVDTLAPSGYCLFIEQGKRGEPMKTRAVGLILLLIGISLTIGCPNDSTSTTRTTSVRTSSTTTSVRALWSKSGYGDYAFDMPTYVKWVKITGSYTGYSSNFMVYVGGKLLVNELLGTGWKQTYYTGVWATTGGAVQIKNSSGVSWSFTEVINP